MLNEFVSLPNGDIGQVVGRSVIPDHYMVKMLVQSGCRVDNLPYPRTVSVPLSDLAIVKKP